MILDDFLDDVEQDALFLHVVSRNTRLPMRLRLVARFVSASYLSFAPGFEWFGDAIRSVVRRVLPRLSESEIARCREEARGIEDVVGEKLRLRVTNTVLLASPIALLVLLFILVR